MCFIEQKKTGLVKTVLKAESDYFVEVNQEEKMRGSFNNG
jgi:hypothetical protein